MEAIVFIIGSKCVSKINEQLVKWTSVQINPDKILLMKLKKKPRWGGIYPPPPPSPCTSEG